MKKYILITLLVFFSGIGVYADEMTSLDPTDVIFRSSLSEIFNDVEDNTDEYNDERDFQTIDKRNMPLFKQIRLRLTNKYRDVSTRSERARENGHRYIPKWKIWNKQRGTYIPIVIEDTDEENTDVQTEEIIENETIEDGSSLSFESGINEEVTEKQLILDSDNINFAEDTGDMVATGRPILEFPAQNTKVVADVMTYNDNGNILKAIGNVVVTKDGKPLTSKYLEIDMNEESMLMDSVIMKTPRTNLVAEKVEQKDGLVILTKGNMYSEESSVHRIASRMVGPRFEDIIVDEDAKALFWGDPDKQQLKIHIKEINIDARENHDIIKLKNIKFYHNDKYFFKWPSLTAYTNKQRDYFEGNYPEFGSRRKLGMFLGPGWVFSGPIGSVVKVIPFVNYKKDFGIGGMVKYVHPNNRTEFGYGSANDIFFLRGKQRLDDNLYIHYGANSYTDEWFIGARMAKYMAEIYYDKSYLNKDFLGKNMDLTFRHRASFGLMQDDDRDYNGERFANASNMSTTRTRYMGELNQSLFNYTDEKNRISLNASVLMQGSAALYGTGDTQFIARFGPNIRTQYKNWMQSVGYYLAGYHDESPMPRYDSYRYGSQSVYITEAIRVHKYLSVGWYGNIALSDDTPNGKMFQENAFLFSIGPDDLKIILGYDFVRQRTYFGFNIAFNPKGTNIEFEKMVIQNPERLGQEDNVENPESQVAFYSAKQQNKNINKYSNSQPLQYAQVIEIEDPDKEKVE